MTANIKVSNLRNVRIIIITRSFGFKRTFTDGQKEKGL